MPRARGRKNKNKKPKATRPPPRKRTRIAMETKEAIHRLADMGMAQKDIATAFQRSPSAISKLLGRDSHPKIGETRPVGRQKLLSPRDVRALKRIVDTAPHASYDAYSWEINAAAGIRIAPRTIGTYLRQQGVLCYKTWKKPHLTNRQMSTRLAWAREHSAWAKEVWRTKSFLMKRC